jgi:hypothetical protein
MVDKRTTELSLVFVRVGLVFLVPVITGKALGLTSGHAQAYMIWGGPAEPLIPVLVEKRLDEGKWVTEPHCKPTPTYAGTLNDCFWTTSGTGVLGGPEAGHVIYTYSGQPHAAPVAKVVFRWYNPRSGTNTCGAVLLEKRGNVDVGTNCHITQGNSATATYVVICKTAYCKFVQGGPSGQPSGGNGVQSTPQKSSKAGNAAQEKGATH